MSTKKYVSITERVGPILHIPYLVKQSLGSNYLLQYITSVSSDGPESNAKVIRVAKNRCTEISKEEAVALFNVLQQYDESILSQLDLSKIGIAKASTEGSFVIHIRPKTTTTAAAGGDKWWKGLSKEDQKAYIKAHPNSKYAHNAKKLAEEKPATKKAPASVYTSVKSLFGEKLKNVPKEHAEFFEHEQDKPGSEERKGMAKHIHTNKHDIIKNIKGQFKEWKDGCGAIGKLAQGKSISAHEKKALKGLLIDAAVTAAAITVTGGFAHGAALAMKHVGFDIVKDVVLKSVIRGTAKAMGASMGHTGALVGLQVLASAADNKKKKQIDQDKLNDKILSQIVDQLAKFMESGDIPQDAWEKAIDELSAKNKKTKKR
jgi:hypothetical protein